MVAFATQVKRRRGTTAQNDAFTGAEGEIVVDTQKHTLRVHDGLTQGGFEIARTEDINELNQLILSSVVPAGIVSPFAGTTPPSGWLKCDGSAISRERYADLFAAIGTKYGAGDGSTTFNLPTQSVLPLGTSAPIVYNPSNTVQWVKDLNGNVINSYNPTGSYSSGLSSSTNGISNGILYNETTDGNLTPANIDLHGTHYTNLANSTGAKAIACIKY